MITLDKIFKVLEENNQIVRYSKNMDFEKIELNHLSYNSKDIKEKTLFICKGKLFKAEYLLDAIKRGDLLMVGSIHLHRKYSI